jgi:MFS family permease
VLPRPLRPLGLALASQFLFGILLSLPGTLFGLPQWTEAVDIGLTEQARFLAVFFTGQLLLTALAGSVVDRVGCQPVIALGGAVLAAAFVALARSNQPGSAYLAALLLATGGAALNAASSTLVSVTYRDRRGPMLTVAASFGALGSLLAPALFAGSPAVGAVRYRLVALAAIGLVLAAVSAIGTRTAVPPHPGLMSTLRMLGDRGLVGLILLLALQFGVEASLAGWTAVHAITILPGASGTLLIGVYWSGLLLSRLLAPLTLAHVPKVPIIAVASALVAAGVTATAVAQSYVGLAVAAAVTGLVVGPVTPTILAVAGDRYPERTGGAFGLLLSIAQTGAIILPWSVAQVALASSLRVGWLVPIAAAAAIALGAATAWRRGAYRISMVEHGSR